MNSETSPRGYHHGDLRQALLREAEAILVRDGLPALTLRAAARAAGVSHMAPKNHFGDLRGLLSELAAVGYRRFAASLAAAAETAAPPGTPGRGRAVGAAYVAFARENPGLFTLMFRGERLDPDRPALRDAIAAARAGLGRLAAGTPGGGGRSPRQLATIGVALWSLVHGYAVLLLDGRLNATLAALPGETPESLLDAMLDAVALKGG